MKVRSKLLLVILLPAFTFIFILSYFLSVKTQDLVFDEVSHHLETAANSSERHLSTFFTESQSHLKIIMEESRDEIVAFQDDNNEENLALVVEKLNSLIVFNEEVKRVCFFEKDGSLSVSTNPDFIGRNASGKMFFENSLVKEGVYFLNIDGVLEMLVASPMENENKIIGVLITVFKMDKINEIVSDQSGLGETGEVLLAVKDNGNPRFISDLRFEVAENFEMGLEEGDARPMRLALSGEEKIIDSSFDYRREDVFAVSRFVEDGNLGLVAKIDRAEAFSGLRKLLVVRILTTSLMFIIFYITISFFSKVMVSPLLSLAKVSKIIAAGDFSQRVPETKRKDEIGQLSKIFNQMVEKISQTQSEIITKVESQTQEIEAKANDLEKQRLAILNVLEDVEIEKNRAEKQSRELKKYLMAVENASDHIVITDNEGKILYLNEAAEQITGFKQEEVLGQKAGSDENWGGQMDKNVYVDFWKVVSEEKKVFLGEFENIKKDGSKYVAQASVAPILDDNGEVLFYVGIERDVTKIKDIDRMKTEFISLASHQLRTPLSAIKWFLEMLMAGDAGKLNKEQMEFVNNINDSNERMIDLVNSLLNVSRIESGRIIIDPKPTNLKDLVDQIVKELTPNIEEKGHQLIISAHPDLPDINIDPKLISNVYLNLISNAIKYTPENGEISIFISKKDEQIVSQVSDNGYGIPKKHQDNIFNKFFRAENVVKFDTNGNGLGLYLVKAIIDSSGGEVWFESEEEKGTSFFFSLPLSGSEAKDGEVSIS
jgi:PAS domain S-box-containing protein